ncbi:hypothetical protein ONE63_005811 [Megalurothrips usitatus]|uniref:Uncharacterized protein n=1 Tax=Megalurothrips usitatus TaxID=439358 RepID=A0AAV7Y3K7_9NEOP|nr:hypothetical protein ONE63_005811 [Megalurothrips usitatus]
MYEDPLLLEEGAVLRASSLLGDEDVRLVVVSSPDMADALRASHRDTHQVFVSTVMLGICHAPERMASRVFVVR